MANSSKFILICDESGAVGFTDKPAREDEPIGVVAGLLLSEDDFVAVKEELTPIVQKYESQDGKLHMAGLPNDSKEKFRQEIFELIDVSDGRIVYEAAVHKEMQERCAQEQKIWDDFKKSKEAEGYSYNVPKVSVRILSALFQCCFIRALHSDIVEEVAPSCCEFIIYTDPLDEPILDEIHAQIYSYLNIQLTVERAGPFERFNKEEKKVESLEEEVVTKLNLPPGVEVKDMSNVKFKLVTDEFVGILADVVANSILCTLKNAYTKNSSINLFAPQSVAEHTLANRIPKLNEPEDFDLLQNVNFVEIKDGNFVLPEGMTFETYFFGEPSS